MLLVGINNAHCAYLDLRHQAHLNSFMFSRLCKVPLVDNGNIRTRLNDDPVFNVCFPHEESFKRSVQYSGAILWDNLPAELQQIDNLHAFKTWQKQNGYNQRLHCILSFCIIKIIIILLTKENHF